MDDTQAFLEDDSDSDVGETKETWDSIQESELPDNMSAPSKQIESKWIHLHPLSPTVREPHIVEMIDSIGAKLDHPLKMQLISVRPGSPSYCCFEMDSIQNAIKFVEKYNDSIIKHLSMTKLRVYMLETSKMKRRFPDEKFESLKSSIWLRITNLKPGISEDKLKKKIYFKTGVDPKYVDIRHHSQSTIPSFALVQIGNVKHTQKVMTKCQMYEWEGYKMWIHQHKGLETRRFEHLALGRWRLVIRNLPMDIEEHQIKTLCARYGIVIGVQLLSDGQGYFTRHAEVRMKGCHGAKKVFDKLHGIKIKGRIIMTAYRSWHSDTNSLSIDKIPDDTTRDQICEFVMNAVDERPLRIGITKLESKSFLRALVHFSSPKLVSRCISKLTGQKFNGQSVKLDEGMYISKDIVKGVTRFKICNLSRNVDEQMILDHLQEYSGLDAPPQNISLRHHLRDDLKMGYAIIEVDSHEDAEDAAYNTCMKELDGRKCWVELMLPLKEGQRDRLESEKGISKKLKLENLHWTWDKKKVKEICADYGGSPSYVRVHKDPDGYPMCMAIVAMQTTVDAQELFDQLHGEKVDNMRIVVKYDPYEKQRREAGGSGAGKRARGAYRSRGAGYRRGGSRGGGHGRLSGNPFLGHSKMDRSASRVVRGRSSGRGRSGRGSKYV